MPRIELDLNKADDQKKIKGQWRVGPGLVPGEANEGLKAQLLNTPARLPDYDDSKWEVCANIRKSLSVGFTFAWYRITVEIPAQVDGVLLADSRVFFETNVDNYGEIWIDGKIDRAGGVIVGINAQQRVEVSAKACDRLSGGERPARRAAWWYFHALRHSSFRVSRVSLNPAFRWLGDRMHTYAKRRQLRLLPWES